MTGAAASPEHAEFLELVGTISQAIAGQALDSALAATLNGRFPIDSGSGARLAGLLALGAQQGWLCQREGGGIRYGRAVKPGAAAGTFSVDVVLMDDIAGPYHIHPLGEIGFVVPISGAPRLDGYGAGWYVYGPGSAHSPTVRGGAAYVLYLLPDGRIDFTQQ